MSDPTDEELIKFAREGHPAKWSDGERIAISMRVSRELADRLEQANAQIEISEDLNDLFIKALSEANTWTIGSDDMRS